MRARRPVGRNPPVSRRRRCETPAVAATGFGVDLGPLRRSRDLRLLFVGGGVSFFGQMLTYVAVPYQVYRITRSSFMVGLVSLAQLAGLLPAGFLGGALADAADRRRMLRVTEVGLALTTAA